MPVEVTHIRIADGDHGVNGSPFFGRVFWMGEDAVGQIPNERALAANPLDGQDAQLSLHRERKPLRLSP